MPAFRPFTSEISYASSASTKSGRALIRVIENASGRLRLIQRADGYQDDISHGQDFWAVMADRYGLSLDVVGGSLDNIPRNGPLIVIANHPYGILDGLMMGHILSQTRGDFRILANNVFQGDKRLNTAILPISFEESRKAQLGNIQTRKAALNFLATGGAVGIFPGGTVSTGTRVFSHPMDPGWRHFTARMVARSSATVVPLFFDGHTSKMFQIASHLHPTLRLGLLIREFRKRVDCPVQVVIGKPLGRDILDPLAKQPKAMMDFLRKSTYELSPTPLKSYDYGYEFEDRHRA
ncbi:MAG: lysophospholipid acyltransferase family protein [Rhodobacteraceae bacterium]|nr:lysophospholipid acyltransferase family protein [Paracoccaceae bacterium]